MKIGEPYAYSYHIKNPDDLIEKLTKALNTPIEP